MKNSRAALRTAQLVTGIVAAAAAYALKSSLTPRRPGQIVLITGGSRGLGLALAERYGRAGAKLILAARDLDELTAARQTLLDDEAVQSPEDVLLLPADLADPDQALMLLEHAISHFGRIDILINNAGMSIRKPPHELELDEWNKVIETNLTSAFLCAHAAYPEMKKAGGGKIINIGSMMSIFGASFATAYAASKGGIVQYTRACANAWAPDNIQVNAILPGWIDTDLTRGARQQVSGLHERVLARTPAGRWGDIDDFAGIAVFLASSASAFVTGTAIPVDGGFSVMA